MGRGVAFILARQRVQRPDNRAAVCQVFTVRAGRLFAFVGVAHVAIFTAPAPHLGAADRLPAFVEVFYRQPFATLAALPHVAVFRYVVSTKHG